MIILSKNTISCIWNSSRIIFAFFRQIVSCQNFGLHFFVKPNYAFVFVANTSFFFKIPNYHKHLCLLFNIIAVVVLFNPFSSLNSTFCPKFTMSLSKIKLPESCLKHIGLSGRVCRTWSDTLDAQGRLQVKATTPSPCVEWAAGCVKHGK